MNNMDTLYKDDYERTMQSETEFHDFLARLDGEARWETKTSKDINILSTEGLSGATELDQDVFKDTCNNTGLFMATDGLEVPIGGTALKSLEGRARIHGSSLVELEKGILAKILNYCLEKAKGSALIRWHNGKVRAAHAEREYSILPMPDLFAETSTMLHGDFDKAAFQYGYYDHSVTTAVWNVMDDAMVEAYKKTMAKYGIEANGDLSAAIRVTTSDVGVSGANISYSLFDGGRRTVLGKSLKLEHRKGATIEKFTDNLSITFGQYQSGLARLERLMEKRVANPENAIKGLMRRVGISKKLIGETVERFLSTSGGCEANAYEVYAGICECLFIAECGGESGRRLVDLEEDVAGILSLKWSDYDFPGDFKW